MRRAAVYGLQVDAHLPLPELVDGDPSLPADVVVREAPVPDAPDVADTWAHPAPGRATLLYDRAVRVGVTDGREIAVQPVAPVPPGVSRLPVLGGALGHLLHQRGLLVLHADALAHRDVAFAVVGARGLGKSTTAAALCTAGFALLADDVVGVDAGGMVAPGAPWLRLWPDAVTAVGADPERLRRVHPEIDKRWLPAPRAADRPLPLARIYVLDRGDAVQIAPLTGAEAVVTLASHDYVGAALDAAGRAASLRRVAALASRASVRRLTIPPDLTSLPAVAATVRRDLDRR